MKIIYNINQSLTEKKGMFLLPILLAFIFSIFSCYTINAQEDTSEIYGADGAFIYEENANQVTIKNVYIEPGTILVGTEYFNNATVEPKPTIAVIDKKNNDTNNVLGVSKEFAPQQRTQDNTLKEHQERSNEKVENTFFIPLSNPSLPTFQKGRFVLGIVTSSISSFNFGSVAGLPVAELSSFNLKLHREIFYFSFLFVEKRKTGKSSLRGPPSPVFA